MTEEPDRLPNGIPYRWRIADDDDYNERLCHTSAGYEGDCGPDYWCGSPDQKGMDYHLDNVIDQEFIMFDLVNFNNLGIAMATIF